MRGQTVSLSGTSVFLPPVLSANPPSLTFASQQVGVAGLPLTLTVTNSGGARAAANVGFQITGPAAASFSAGAPTCGASLDAGASCTAQVVFTPAASGGAAATLTISSSTTGVTPVTVPLSGTGLSAAGLSVSPAQLTFQPQTLNQPSAPQAVTISNSGGVGASGLTLTVSGPFSLAQNTCGSSLAAGASCTAPEWCSLRHRGGALTGSLTVTSSWNVTTPATVAAERDGRTYRRGPDSSLPR